MMRAVGYATPWIIAALVGVAAWTTPAYGMPLALGAVGLVFGAAMVPVVSRKAAPDEGKDASGNKGARHAERPVRVLIIGAGAVGRALAKQMEEDGSYDIVGFVDDDLDVLGDKDWPVLGRRDATSSIIRHYQIDEVVLAYAPTWQQDLVGNLAERHPEICIRVVPSYFEAMLRSSHVENIGDIALLR